MIAIAEALHLHHGGNGQTGDSDTQWESDEIVYIKENGADLCESSCDLSITIQYNGQVLSGTNSVTVA